MTDELLNIVRETQRTLAAEREAQENGDAPYLSISTPDYERGVAMTVLDEIAAERRRQIAKGWTPEHDDQHTYREILSADWGASNRVRMAIAKSDRRLLIEAAALIVAEIERLDRAATRTQEPRHDR